MHQVYDIVHPEGEPRARFFRERHPFVNPLLARSTDDPIYRRSEELRFLRLRQLWMPSCSSITHHIAGHSVEVL